MNINPETTFEYELIQRVFDAALAAHYANKCGEVAVALLKENFTGHNGPFDVGGVLMHNGALDRYTACYKIGMRMAEVFLLRDIYSPTGTMSLPVFKPVYDSGWLTVKVEWK